jgi:hypothetical protein
VIKNFEEWLKFREEWEHIGDNPADNPDNDEVIMPSNDMLSIRKPSSIGMSKRDPAASWLKTDVAMQRTAAQWSRLGAGPGVAMQLAQKFGTPHEYQQQHGPLNSKSIKLLSLLYGR